MTEDDSGEQKKKKAEYSSFGDHNNADDQDSQIDSWERLRNLRLSRSRRNTWVIVWTIVIAVVVFSVICSHFPAPFRTTSFVVYVTGSPTPLSFRGYSSMWISRVYIDRLCLVPAKVQRAGWSCHKKVKNSLSELSMVAAGAFDHLSLAIKPLQPQQRQAGVALHHHDWQKWMISAWEDTSSLYAAHEWNATSQEWWNVSVIVDPNTQVLYWGWDTLSTFGTLGDQTTNNNTNASNALMEWTLHTPWSYQAECRTTIESPFTDIDDDGHFIGWIVPWMFSDACLTTFNHPLPTNVTVTFEPKTGLEILLLFSIALVLVMFMCCFLVCCHWQCWKNPGRHLLANKASELTALQSSGSLSAVEERFVPTSASASADIVTSTL